MSLFSKIKSTLKGRPITEQAEDDTPFTYSLAETLKAFESTVTEKSTPKATPAPSNNNYIEFQLAPLTNKILATQSLKEIISTLTADLKDLFDCEMVTIFGLDRKNRQIYSRNFQWKLKNEIRLNISMNSLAGFVAATGKILNVKNANNPQELEGYHPDLRLDNTWDGGKSKFKTSSVLVVPLSHNKQLMGVLELRNKKSDSAFTTMDVRMAKEVSLTLGHALMRAEVEAVENELKAAAHSIHSAKSTDEIFLECKDLLLQLFSAKFLTIYMVDFDTNEIFSKYKTGDSVKEIRLPISCASIAGFVAVEHQLVNIADVYDDEQLKKVHPDLVFDKSWDRKSGVRTRSILASPLMYENELMGVLQIANKPTFNKYDEKTITSISNTLGLALFKQLKKQEAKRTKYSFLVDNNLLTPDELKQAIATARNENRDIEVVFLDDFKLKRSDIGKSLELFYKIPYMGYPPAVNIPLSEDARHFYKNNSSESEWALLALGTDSAKVLLPDPSDQKLIEQIKELLARDTLKINVGLRADINDYHAYYSLTEEAEPEPAIQIAPVADEAEDVADETEELEETPVSGKIGALDDLLEEEEDATEVELDVVHEKNTSPLPFFNTRSIAEAIVTEMLFDGHEKNASHIHIEPASKSSPALIRFRIDGVCRVYKELQEKNHEIVVAFLKEMSASTKRAGDSEGTLRLNRRDEEIIYSLLTVPVDGGKEEIILRSRSNVKLIPLERMGLASRHLNIIQNNISKPHGLIVVAGHAGAGKTVTLHSLLAQINVTEKKILTAETSIEIAQKGLHQVILSNEPGKRFADLGSVFMQADPDVIMVGEVNDRATFQAALESASRGFLTIIGVHANSASAAVEHLMSFTRDSRKLADALTLVIAQQLVRTLCKNCKEDYQPSEDAFNSLVQEYGENDFSKLGLEYGAFLTLKKPMGCQMCNESGFSGRVALHEVLEVSPKIKRLIRCKSDVEEIRKQAQRDGMTTMKQDAIMKVLKGTCELKHAFSHFQI
ncbi:MAG: hypothetical protein COV66_14880 [Nitrospinae bacterium CG11_big_fil_rev_8_21_14_0_20_45_15]|nr:MAG: hypothetical protein COV66_14880 [Nitrospinae bacterium CG11_big_fil_rev_8_21_14_0_20_45_15]